MRPLARDLFGEIPVTLDELLAWMLAVPRLPPTSPRFAWYVRGWNVIDKIRAAKESGTFEAIVNAPPAPPPYRLAAAIDAAGELRRRYQRHAVGLRGRA